MKKPRLLEISLSALEKTALALADILASVLTSNQGFSKIN